MRPGIGPIGLDYIAGTVGKTATKVDVLDLCLSDAPFGILRNYFATQEPELVGISFRKVEDCFWPSAEWFVPDLADTISKTRNKTDASIIIGGVGFSIFAERIVEYTAADFGIRGDGEQTILSLLDEPQGQDALNV